MAYWSTILIIIFICAIVWWCLKNHLYTPEIQSTTKPEPPPQPLPQMAFYIISAESCPACIYYKNHIHDNLTTQLSKYPNLTVSYLTDPDLIKEFNTSYYPTFVVATENKFEKLPINVTPTLENVTDLMNALNPSK